MEEVDLTKSLRQGPSQLVVTRIEDSQGWEECLIGTGVWEWPTAHINLSVCPQRHTNCGNHGQAKRLMDEELNTL